MSSSTTNINLFKYDTVADKKSQFNINTALNENFDKIDTAVGTINTEINNTADKVLSNLAPGGIEEIISVITNAKYIPANTTIYVATTGNDTTGDGTSSAPFATLYGALSSLNGKRLLGGLTIKIADGTYTRTESIVFIHPDSILVSIIGNLTNLDNVVLNFNNCWGIQIPVGGTLNIGGVKFQGNSSIGSVYGILNDGGHLFSLGGIKIDGFYNNFHNNPCARSSLGHPVVSSNAHDMLLSSYGNSMVEFYNSSATFTGIGLATKTIFGVLTNFGGCIRFNGVAGNTISNCNIGCACDLGGNVLDTNVTYSNCTTSRSPASNTIGNRNSYIAT